MALPGLVRVATVAKVLGVCPATARKHLRACQAQPIRRPRESAKSADGPWYVTLEDAVRLVDWLLPRLVASAANRRARRRLAEQSRLLGLSGQCVAYRPPAPPSEAPVAKPPPHPIPHNFLP